MQHAGNFVLRGALTNRTALLFACFEGQDIYIPLRREEAVVEKEARVREEVRARKTVSTEQQTVSGQVRKEDIEVERGDQERRKAA